MVFLNSLKLFGSNWSKVLKFFLYYICIWGLCFALFLPVFFEFKDLVISNFQQANLQNAFAGVFQGSLGLNLHNLIHTSYSTCVEIFNANLWLAIYGLIVLFVFLPFFVNLGKYVLNEMLYSYMASKNKLGFFSALVRSLRKSLLYALCRTIYNCLFSAFALVTVYGIGLIENVYFIKYLLPLVECIVLVLLFALYQMLMLGWTPALIVFGCNVFAGNRKGMKSTKRHFWSFFASILTFFAIFWVLVLIFGVYTMTVLVPLVTALLCVFDMTAFFTSQGMRFYINANKILTPKKLEEVDNINKTAYIL